MAKGYIGNITIFVSVKTCTKSEDQYFVITLLMIPVRVGYNMTHE